MTMLERLAVGMCESCDKAEARIVQEFVDGGTYSLCSRCATPTEDSVIFFIPRQR